MAMMRQPIQQRGGQLGVAEHAAPFREGQIGRDDDACRIVSNNRFAVM